VLAENDENAGRNDDRRPDQHFDSRHVREDQVADDQRQDERGVLERGNHRHFGMPVGLGDQDLSDPASDP
jgi:hypothetical protein